jgi:hypothetical protein
MGSEGSSVTPNGCIEIEYSEADNGFFPELVRLVISMSAIGIGFELHKTGIVKPSGPGQPMVLEGKQGVSGLEIHFFPAPLYGRLLSPTGRQPRFMRIIKKQVRKSPAEHPIKLGNVQLLMARLAGDAFVSYYERHVDVVESIWGKEKNGNWPSEWDFGWAMRNACAHNGLISIWRKDHPGVIWKNLKYGYADNDRQVLFDEITGVELILLMEEMDAKLRQTVGRGVPPKCAKLRP